MPVHLTCQTCGTPFSVKPSHAATSRACSRSCKSNGYAPTPLADRFWPKINKTDGCWLWTGATSNNGYGHLLRGGRGNGNIKAHQASWELHFGPIPEGLLVLHRCDVRACVRPDHLFLGTYADNNRDRVAKRRGHIGDNHPARLHPEQVIRDSIGRFAPR